jgi:hypothetical protein
MPNETVPCIHWEEGWMHPTASLDVFRIIYYAGSPIHRIHAKSHRTLEEVPLLYNTNTVFLSYSLKHGEAMPANSCCAIFKFCLGLRGALPVVRIWSKMSILFQTSYRIYSHWSTSLSSYVVLDSCAVQLFQAIRAPSQSPAVASRLPRECSDGVLRDLNAEEYWPVLDCWQVMAADMVACLAHCPFYEGQPDGMLLTYSRGRAMPQTVSRRPLPADLLPRRRGFDPGPTLARFVLNKMAVRQFSLRVLPFFHVNIISPTLHTHSIICYRRCINLASDIIVKQHTSEIYSECKNQKPHA